MENLSLNFEISSNVNPSTGLTEKIILNGLTIGVSNEGNSFITVHYEYKTLANGVVVTTTNGGYRLDEKQVSVAKSGAILPALDSQGNPILDENGNIVPRVDACSKFITALYNAFFEVLRLGIIEYETAQIIENAEN